MGANHDISVCALLIGDYPRSRLLVHEIFLNAGWRLYEARDRKRALECLERRQVQVVIASRDMPHWPWQAVLRDLRHISRAPQLIVTSRVADDSLWAEVLNCGGYDVLVEPFQREEISRVVAAARRHWESKRALAATGF